VVIELDPETDTLWGEVEGQFYLSLENEQDLIGFENYIEIFSSDGLTWDYVAQPDGYDKIVPSGPSGSGLGHDAITVVPGSGMDLANWDMALYLREIGTDGIFPDTILLTGAIMYGPGPAPGPLEKALPSIICRLMLRREKPNSSVWTR